MTGEARLVALLEAVACEKRPCRFCGKLLYLVKTNSGKIAPYTAEGFNHFEDCPEFWKRPGSSAEQQSLLGTSEASGFDPQR